MNFKFICVIWSLFIINRTYDSTARLHHMYTCSRMGHQLPNTTFKLYSGIHSRLSHFNRWKIMIHFWGITASDLLQCNIRNQWRNFKFRPNSQDLKNEPLIPHLAQSGVKILAPFCLGPRSFGSCGPIVIYATVRNVFRIHHPYPQLQLTLDIPRAQPRFKSWDPNRAKPESRKAKRPRFEGEAWI